MFRHLTLSWLALWIQSFSALALEEQLSLQSVVTTPTLTVFENYQKNRISKKFKLSQIRWNTFLPNWIFVPKMSKIDLVHFRINFWRENSYVLEFAKLYKMRLFAAIFKHYEDLRIRRSSSKTYDNSRG